VACECGVGWSVVCSVYSVCGSVWRVVCVKIDYIASLTHSHHGAFIYTPTHIHIHTHTHILPLSHTHTYTHTLSLSHTHTHSHTHLLPGSRRCCCLRMCHSERISDGQSQLGLASLERLRVRKCGCMCDCECVCIHTFTHVYIHIYAIHHTPAPQYHHTTQLNTPHYTTLHYTTLHYTTLHYTTLHYTTLHHTYLRVLVNRPPVLFSGQLPGHLLSVCCLDGWQHTRRVQWLSVSQWLFGLLVVLCVRVGCECVRVCVCVRERETECVLGLQVAFEY
jgi:hypothetical protein